MDITDRNFRAMIFYDYKEGLTQQQCAEKLKRLFGDKAPSLATVEECFKDFGRGPEEDYDDY